ncbi:olfactory receptor 11A1-like [Ascaphus truei]|uniref:olfactory receptor 11A1-like n=1 Tax=Ascaphus truei TaxID=8439 RepID=UPI003F5A63BC
MFQENQTTVTEFLLLGFPSLKTFNVALFILFLVIYIMTLGGNLLIIILVSNSQSLKSPMYIFLCHLSLSDMLLTTNIAPNMLYVVLNGGGTIHVTGCITQFYFYGISTAVETLLLTVMSLDRYLAICNPLRYTSIMDFRLSLHLVTGTWLIAFLLMIFIVIPMCQLQFCGPHIIDHYFCDYDPLLELSCSDTSIVKLGDFVIDIPVILFPFVFITFTYVSISLTILRIPSTTGKQKAFSTCSSHLALVGTFYGTIIAIYMAPYGGQSFNVNKVLSLLYTVGTPLFNPVIYSLRNQEIKLALRKCLYIRRSSSIKIKLNRENNI